MTRAPKTYLGLPEEEKKTVAYKFRTGQISRQKNLVGFIKIARKKFGGFSRAY